MPKIKTKKAVQARFKITGTNKLKRFKPGRRHILTKKTKKRKRHLRKAAIIDKSQVKIYSRLLGLI